MLNPHTLNQSIYYFFEFGGTIAFALTGALVAIKKRMDLSGMIVLAFITGNGGGTIRDLILGQPVFWTVKTYYIYLTVLTAILAFFSYRFFTSLQYHKWRKQVLLLVDAFGLVAFTIDGVSKGLVAEPMIVAIMMGTLTAVGGGMLRDVLANEVPMIFSGQLYASPTVLGGIAYALLYPHFPNLALVVCTGLIISLRLLGIYRGWHLPSIKQTS